MNPEDLGNRNVAKRGRPKKKIAGEVLLQKNYKQTIGKSKKNSQVKKNNNTKSESHFVFNTGIIFLILFVLFLGVLLFLRFQFRPVVETRKTDLVRIPKDVKMKASLASPSAELRVPILMYHYVEYVQDKKDTIRQSLDIVPATFEDQVKTLKNAGFTFMTASELADVMDGKKPLPPKPILLTFDDGHWDLYTNVLPILEKYNVKATAYIISGFLGGSDFMTRDQLQKVIDSKLIEIGSHTVHHIGLAKVIQPVLQYEINASRADLEKYYHIHIVTFAYPGGSFDQKAADAVKDAGYRLALSTIPGIMQSQTNRYYLYRIRPGYRTGDELVRFLDQATFRPW